MHNIEIAWPSNVSEERLATAIDTGIARASLQITMRGTLKRFPGSLHWHVKQGRAAGTLEITVWPAEQRAWFSIQSGRTAPWIDEQIAQLTHFVAHALQDD